LPGGHQHLFRFATVGRLIQRFNALNRQPIADFSHRPFVGKGKPAFPFPVSSVQNIFETAKRASASNSQFQQFSQAIILYCQDKIFHNAIGLVTFNLRNMDNARTEPDFDQIGL
jgi:hypothetical protein